VLSNNGGVGLTTLVKYYYTYLADDGESWGKTTA
jgi:hypothetical protein